MQKEKKHIVILSGAGISAESGLGTFRDSGGLWEQYDISQVATIDAWHNDPKLVLSFYDARRDQVSKAKPNAAHFALAELEEAYKVTIITQNIDDLHEKAGSKHIIHLHGEITKGRSIKSDKPLYPIKKKISLGDKTPDGHQMRPHVVWFGEAVPKMSEAEQYVRSCDILIIVGTSLNVYPAAGLIFACPDHAERFYIDPNEISLEDRSFIHLKGAATEKLPLLADQLIRNS